MLALPAWGHDPITTKLTWTQEISRIVYKHCAGCHKDFTGYEGIRPWAKAIRDEVASRRMPPWGPVKGVGDFIGDASLSGPEIDMLVAWVEGGAPEGDPAYLPHRVVPAESAPPIPVYGRAVTVRSELRLSASSRVVALKPERLAPAGSLEAWAVRPDGEIDRLIWLENYKTNSPRSFVLRDPAVFPAGTRLRVSGPAGAALTFYLK
jgi:hypothetical protein